MKKTTVISVSIFILYVAWLFSIVSRITHWPTAHPLLFAMTPFIIIILGFISIPIVAFVNGVREGMSSSKSSGSTATTLSSVATVLCLLLGLASAGLFLYVEGSKNFNFSHSNKSENIIVKDESQKDICVIYQSPMSEQKISENGFCSFSTYPQTDDLAGNYSLKRNGRECVDAIEKACAEFCGNYVRQTSNNQVYGFLVSFGPEADYDEFHLPFSSSQTVAAVSCDEQYNSKIRDENKEKVINIEAFN